jgi:hypothetical protein
MSNNIGKGYNLNSYLWTGESVWCKCGHHVNCHYTNGFPEDLVKQGYPYSTCAYKTNTNNGHCACTEFRPFKKKEMGIIIEDEIRI